METCMSTDMFQFQKKKGRVDMVMHHIINQKLQQTTLCLTTFNVATCLDVNLKQGKCECMRPRGLNNFLKNVIFLTGIEAKT